MFGCLKRGKDPSRDKQEPKNKNKKKRGGSKKILVVYHRAMNIPEGTLLTVEDFTLELIAFLVDTRLGFGLHEDEFPLSGEHLLKTGKVLCFVVCQLESRLVLHRPLAQVNGVVRVLRLPTVTRPEIRSLI